MGGQRTAAGGGRRHTSGERWLAVLILVVLIAGVVGYFSYQKERRHRQLLAFDCATLTNLTRSTAAERQALLAAESGPTAVFFGDSYTQGVGLTNIRDDYAYVTAAALHWRAVLEGAGATGYISGGPCHGQQLSARLPQVVAHRPQIVVIQAGLDDFKGSSHSIERAADQLYTQMRQDLPHARIFVVGPRSVPKASNVSPVITALRAAAAKAHVAYIDTSSWSFELGKDGIHPTAAGYRAYGFALAQAIRNVPGAG